MKGGLNIFFFGSSLVSAYWNGAATYYRGMIRALNQRGHRVTFCEPDAYERQQHRDMEEPEWARVVVYGAESEEEVGRVVEQARGADLVVKASGVGVFDGFLERAVLDLQRPGTRVVFWDVDAPATLERMEKNLEDPFRSLVPRYDLVLTYGGGNPVVEAYKSFGAIPRRIIPWRGRSGLRRTWGFWETGCRTGKAGWRNFSCGWRRGCRRKRFCWGETDGRTKGGRRM
jgi:spore maturation protein CgeB